MVQEFKKFALRGNVIDLAIAVVIGAAFGAIVQSLVADIIMPPLGLLLGNVDFSEQYLLLRPGTPPGPYATIEAARAAGAVTLNYGRFADAVLAFLIIALVIFFMLKGLNRLHEREVPPPPARTKTCPYCDSAIPIKAVRCPQCTSTLAEPAVS